ncbi:MAG: class I SAM-dependent methyltransferase [Candidatus Nanopelagicales bacterium]
MIKALSHPLTRGIDLDDPRNTLLRRQIIQSKPFLRSLYAEWYSLICAKLQPTASSVLEIGSGAGFLKEFLPGVITSEVFPLEGVDRVEDATALSFTDDSLDAIVMTDVLHHIPDVGLFFAEAVRTLKSNGRLVMIEPWRTPWSDWVYRNLHHEPFRSDADWQLPAGGPLSAANGALPWIVLQRDRAKFTRLFPSLRIMSIDGLMPLSYLASGGVSMRALVPGTMYPGMRAFERRILHERGGMFALIELRRAMRADAQT